MKNCTDCRHAVWNRNAAGNLHPSGSGMCGYQWKLPPLPASMYFVSTPAPFGGAINRRQQLRDHCVYWARVEVPA